MKKKWLEKKLLLNCWNNHILIDNFFKGSSFDDQLEEDNPEPRNFRTLSNFGLECVRWWCKKLVRFLPIFSLRVKILHDVFDIFFYNTYFSFTMQNFDPNIKYMQKNQPKTIQKTNKCNKESLLDHFPFF